jgi:hypothetical protein
MLIRKKQGDNDSTWYTQKDLGDFLGVTKSHISRTVGELIDMGYLVRKGRNISCCLPSNDEADHQKKVEPNATKVESYSTNKLSPTQPKLSPTQPKVESYSTESCAVLNPYINPNINPNINPDNKSLESAPEKTRDAISIYQRISEGAPINPVMAPKWKSEVGDDLDSWEQACMEWKHHKYAWSFPRLLDYFQRSQKSFSQSKPPAPASTGLRPEKDLEYYKREYAFLNC